MTEYAEYPGGGAFEPWQDHDWPIHCGAAAQYLGEVGERELRVLAAGGDVEAFLREHDVDGGDPPITLDMVPPHAPPIVPANEASWDDLRAVFGKRGDPPRCWCQRFKMAPGESWRSVGPDELAFRLRQQTAVSGR